MRQQFVRITPEKERDPKVPFIMHPIGFAASIVAIEAVMMVMVVMMMVIVVAAITGHHDDLTAIGSVVARIERVVMVVVVMVVVIELGFLHSGLRQLRFVDGSQQLCRVRDRLQQFGEGICLQNFSWVRGRRGLGRVQAAERRDGAQQSSDLLIHIGLQRAPARGKTRSLRKGSATIVS
jgi:hypothetical protein